MKVAQIAKDTAGGSENTQKAAEELARLATELRELTLRFREPGGAGRFRTLLSRLSRPPLQPSLPGVEGPRRTRCYTPGRVQEPRDRRVAGEGADD